MPSFITIQGLRPYDGRYELDWNFTTRQYGWVKQFSDNDVDDMIRKIEDGKADAELITVWGIIALHQDGKVDWREVPDLWQRLVDAPFGASVKLETEAKKEEVDEQGPPERSSSLSEDESSPGSRSSSDPSDPPQSASGTPTSDVSASDHLRSVS